MAVTLIGLESATKTTGQSPMGRRVYKLKSTSQITTDIDDILDFSDLPAYNASWDASTNVNLLVSTKRGTVIDNMEGYYWRVEVNYETPTGDSDQRPVDPRDRPWDWNKSTDKYEVVAVSSLFDTSGYVYPEATFATDMVNLGANDAITNTAFDPPEEGLLQSISRSVFTMTKYVDRDGYDDIVTGATSWNDVDAFIDSVNDSTSIPLLGHTYSQWELRMDDINYEPYSENGYDVMRVTLTITADTYRKHVFSFLSAGYNKINDDNAQEPIRDTATGELVQSPRLLDKSGLVIAPPASAPYIASGVYVSAGLNQEKQWVDKLQIPATIP